MTHIKEKWLHDTANSSTQLWNDCKDLLEKIDDLRLFKISRTVNYIPPMVSLYIEEKWWSQFQNVQIFFFDSFLDLYRITDKNRRLLIGPLYLYIFINRSLRFVAINPLNPAISKDEYSVFHFVRNIIWQVYDKESSQFQCKYIYKRDTHFLQPQAINTSKYLWINKKNQFCK